MSLEDEIQDRLVADAQSVLEENLDRVEEFFQLHSDGTINIEPEYREADPEIQILVYLIGQRFAKEGNVAEEDTLANEFFYERIDRKERTIREYLQDLREEGLIKKEGRSDHRLLAENLPATISKIEKVEKSGGESE